MICLDFFLDMVGAVFAADLVAASLTGKFIPIGRGGGKSKNPLVRLALAVTALGILVLVAIAVQHKLGGVCRGLSTSELPNRDSSTDCHAL